MIPDVSVIIPTYNRPFKTARALRSALGQRDVNLEVIVVDDGSPTPFRISPDVQGAPVRLIVGDRNLGAAAARNAGVSNSKAPLLCFLDSDDFLVPNTLAKRIASLRALPQERPLLLTGTVWRWQPQVSLRLVRPVESCQTKDLASGCWYCPGSTGLFTRETWRAVGPLDARLRRLEDLDWGVRLGSIGGSLRVAPYPVAVVERAGRASSAHVGEAAAIMEDRYGRNSEHPLQPDHFRRLRGYLALERASAALGERRLPRFGVEMMASFCYQPRFSIQLKTWWTQRNGTPAEAAAIEDMARSLGKSG